MGKQSGLGDQLFVAGYDIGADINSIGTLSTPRTTLPATGITAEAMERMYGTADGQGEFTSYFNDATDRVHEALKGLPTTDVQVMYCRGEGVGNEAFCIQAKQTSYDPSRGDDGSLLFGTAVLGAAYAADWAEQLTAGKDTHASATNGSSIDTTASASFGWQAYLQAFSIGSGTATVTIEDSADNVTFAAVTGGAFTDVTARTAQRLASASATATLRRYVRVATSGVFTDLVFAVAINKNLATRTVS